MATETKQMTKTRLMGEKRWREFVACREAFKEAGDKPDIAHRKALEKFQPLDGSPAEAPGYDVSKPPPKGRPKGGSLRRDARWVYEHLDQAKPIGPYPSPGAKKLHSEARNNAWEFLVLAMKMFGGPGGEGKGRKRGQTADDFLETVDGMLEEIRAVRRGSEDAGGKPGVPLGVGPAVPGGQKSR